MAATLHPHYLKHMLHGNIPVREKTGGQMISDVRSSDHVNVPPADRTEQISVLDISGDMASAKLVTPHWVDYMDPFEVQRRMENSLGRSAHRPLSQKKQKLPKACGAGISCRQS